MDGKCWNKRESFSGEFVKSVPLISGSPEISINGIKCLRIQEKGSKVCADGNKGLI